MINLVPKYSLFESSEVMLTVETLSKLLHEPVEFVDIQPMNGHSGLAGGQLSYVNTNVRRLVLKRMSITFDWIMFASQDTNCRSVKLWQYGLLDELIPHLEHHIIACAQDGDSWFILMEDLSSTIFTSEKPMTADHIFSYLDSLARMHASFLERSTFDSPGPWFMRYGPSS